MTTDDDKIAIVAYSLSFSQFFFVPLFASVRFYWLSSSHLNELSAIIMWKKLVSFYAHTQQISVIQQNSNENRKQ